MIDINQFRADHLIKVPLGILVPIKDKLINVFHASPLLSLSFIAFIIFLVVFLYLLRKFWNISKLLRQNSIFLELTPPAITEKTSYTTQQLFSVLHNLGSQRTILEKILGKKVLFSFEIVSSKEFGIRYLIRTTIDDAHILERTILSYLPQVRVKRVVEYLPSHISVNKTKIVEFKLRKHFAFPLTKQNNLKEHDPVAYITGMMTKLQRGEVISLQIVASPTKTSETNILSHKILHNEDVLNYLNAPRMPWFISPVLVICNAFIKIINIILKEIGWAITEVAHGSSVQQTNQVQQVQMQNYLSQMNLRPARVLSSFEQETVTSIQEKVAQPLYATAIRAFIMVHDKQDSLERVRGMKSSFAPFSVPGYQSLKPLFNILPVLTDSFRLFTYRYRLLSIFSNSTSSLLSVSEIADLYHFPFTQVTQTENIIKMHSKELPAPISLKKGTDNLDVIFAKNTFGGSTTMIGLTKDERRRHMYIIGATGTGKSTMILSMVNQDINNDKGVAVVDPHGELAESVLACIPENRMDDLIYFNPDDLKYPIGINLMELTPGLDEEDALREKEFIAESVISLFRKVFSTAMTGSPHRIEYILRNTIHTAFIVENPTLFTIFDLLNNPVYQKKVVSQLKDENLKNFWKFEFGKAGDYQKVKMISPVTARIGRFLFSPSAKRILEQPKSTINFDEILNGKILICNLAKGKLGEDTSQVLGIMILNKLQLAALKRARIPSVKRKDFYLYVDEFQNFATKSFVEMLSESRKYKLNLVMAEQSTSQQNDRNLVHIILANAGTVVTFKSANPEDELLMLPQYLPYINTGEITNLPAYHFFMKISALNPEEPFSGETILINPKVDAKRIAKLIQASRKNYAIEYKKPTDQQEKITVTKDEVTEKSSVNYSQDSKATGALPEMKVRK